MIDLYSGNVCVFLFICFPIIPEARLGLPSRVHFTHKETDLKNFDNTSRFKESFVLKTTENSEHQQVKIYLLNFQCV